MSRPGISLAPSGRAPLHLRHLVLDYNGTLACRGRLLPGVVERLRALGELVAVHVITLDTFGSARAELAGELAAGNGVSLDVVDGCAGGEAEAKLALLQSLMLEAAALSICVMGREGCAVDTLRRAHICVADIGDALDLLLYPESCAATLRR